jgi:hypothetical protein
MSLSDTIQSKVDLLNLARSEWYDLKKRMQELEIEISDLRKKQFEEKFNLKIGDCVYIYEHDYRFAGLPKVMSSDTHIRLKEPSGGKAFDCTGPWALLPFKRPKITI